MKLENLTLMYCGAIRGINSDTELNDAIDLNDVTKVEFFLNKTYEPLDPSIFLNVVTPSWWSQLFLQDCEEVHIVEFRDSYIIDKIQTTSSTALLQEYEVVFTLLSSFG